MPVCGDSAYEMIETVRGTDELDKTLIFLATITGINRGDNTASLATEDACLEGIDLSAVGFFYHCEFSAGTVEDLAKGNNAFKVGDSVYVVYTPQAETDRMYIFGHADERATKKCLGGAIAVGHNLIGSTYVVWEKPLGKCIDLEEPLFPYRPTVLTQVRYKREYTINDEPHSEYISLFHYTYIVYTSSLTTVYLAVSVNRRGKMFTIPVESGSSLQLYGALSWDFETLYITSSTSAGGPRTISYAKYSWNEELETWVAAKSGPVNTSAYSNTQGRVTVDRSGRIYAAWDWTPQDLSYLSQDYAVCQNVWPNGPFYYHSISGHVDTGKFYLFDIDSTSFVEQEKSMSRGMTIANGDYHVARSDWEQRSYNKKDISGGANQSAGYRHLWYGKSIKNYSNYQVGSVEVDGEIICTADTGYHQTYGASLDNLVQSDGFVYHTTTSFSHSGYEDQTGSHTAIPIGGWIFTNDVLFDRHLSGNNYSNTTLGQNPIACPPFNYNEINYWSVLSFDVNQYSARWPVPFSCHSVANAFFSYDAELDTWYAGALVNYENGGDYSWKIYRDGENVTGIIAACVGDLNDTLFSAIYFTP